ncbi:MAG: thioredoxin [Bacillota bacterium]
MAITTLTMNNFDAEVLQSKDTVLIDFWASWCGPCRMLGPVIDEIATAAPKGVKVCKVDVDAEPELASKFRVMSIPTLVVLKDGRIVGSSVGVKPKQAILGMLQSA